MVWYPKMDQKVFKFGEGRSIVCYCTQEEKMNFEGFTQNGCYGNQPQPFEALTVPVLLQNKTDSQISISCKFLFCSVL